MYCDAEKLSEIRDQLLGKQLKEVYPDWGNGVIYLRFSDSFGSTVMVKIKNNYYAGIGIMDTAEIKRSEIK